MTPKVHIYRDTFNAFACQTPRTRGRKKQNDQSLGKMQKSSSSFRGSEELLNNTNTNDKSTVSDEDQLAAGELPTYDPLSHVAKKERSRLRSMENAIHVVPLVLVLCTFVLWLFSHPESRA